MFAAADLTVFLGGKPILDAVSFRVEDGERVAVVGPNGAGKSTLLKAVAGLVGVESGEIALPKGTTIGYLPQDPKLNSHRTVRDEMRSVFEEALSAFDEMRDLERRMGEIDHDSEEFKRIARRYDFLQSEVHRLDAWSMDANIGQVSAGLGFRAEDLDRSCDEFSGGWQTRVALAKTLLGRPDVLLMDEPTNHLDLETIEWLEEWILGQPCSLMMVSHERSFMDRLAHRIFEINRSRLTVYRGGYGEYLEQREERRAHQQRAYENQQREIERNERFINRFRAQANKAASVQSRVKFLEKLERLEPPPSDPSTIRFKFPAPPRSNKEVAIIDGVGHRYGEAEVFRSVDWTVYRGEKIALVGVNGAGKSTLIKILAGRLKPTRGECRLGQRVDMQYFAQYEGDDLRPNWTVENALMDVAPAGEGQRARDVAGAFLFSNDDVEKPVEVLSGGERTRLRLARMLFSPANLLLLDEPTNHLDVGSRQTLERALGDYEGTLVIVSHDRVFVDRVATKIVEIRDGEAREFPGTYREYLRRHREEMGLADREFPEQRRRAPGQASADATEPENQSGKKNGGARPAVSEEDKALLASIQAVPQRQTRQNRKDDRRKAAESRKSRNQTARPIRDRVRRLEKDIERVEKRQAEIDEILVDPETYSNMDRVAELNKEKKQLDASLEKTMAEWEKASEELEAALAD